MRRQGGGRGEGAKGGAAESPARVAGASAAGRKDTRVV